MPEHRSGAQISPVRRSKVNSMAMQRRLTLALAQGAFLLTGILIGCPGGAAVAAEPAGIWLVGDKDAHIHVESCDGGYVGSVVWERDPADTDTKNPDPALRSRPILGLAILMGMKPTAKSGEWEGRVYNPNDGGTFTARMTLLRPDVLRIEGCILGGLICNGENWTRVEATPTGAAYSRTRSACAAPAAASVPARKQTRN